MEIPILAIIGGSGLYSLKELEQTKIIDIETPFGNPSAPIMVGNIQNKPIAFLARHGIGHHISPSEVNYRANIFALKSVGVNKIISISACGSLREDYAPGDIVIPNQIFDFTHKRSRSFFENGIVAHISSADPFCQNLSNLLSKASEDESIPIHKGGTYITIEGPRFSTKAESQTYRSWGMSVIGMTASPEAFLAREAEMCYATMAHVTDYDVWHKSEDSVSVEMVIQTLQKNTEIAQRIIINLIGLLDTDYTCSCHSALKDAIITEPEKMNQDTVRKLREIVKKYVE